MQSKNILKNKVSKKNKNLIRYRIEILTSENDLLIKSLKNLEGHLVITRISFIIKNINILLNVLS